MSVNEFPQRSAPSPRHGVSWLWRPGRRRRQRKGHWPVHIEVLEDRWLLSVLAVVLGGAAEASGGDVVRVANELLFRSVGAEVRVAEEVAFESVTGLRTVTLPAGGGHFEVVIDVDDLVVRRRGGTELLRVGVGAMAGLLIEGGGDPERIHLHALTATDAARIGDVTVNAAGGDDTLVGSAGADVLNGGPGNDLVHALGGDDSVTGGDEDDSLRGDAGNHTLLGGEGNDSLVPGSGSDIALGEAGEDTTDSGDGEVDTVAGSGNGTTALPGDSPLTDTRDVTDEDAVASLGAPRWIALYGGDGGEEMEAVRPTSDGGFIVAGVAWRNDQNQPEDLVLMRLAADGTVGPSCTRLAEMSFTQTSTRSLPVATNATVKDTAILPRDSSAVVRDTTADPTYLCRSRGD